MTRTKESALLLAFIILLLAGGGGAAWFLLGEEAPATHRVPIDPTGAPSRPVPNEIPQDPSLPLAELGPRDRADENLETSVIHPLRVELSLLQRSVFGDASLLSIGSGAEAGIRGSVLGLQGEGFATSVEFVAGSNQGRVLHCDAQGRFGANNLYPGIAIVRIEGPPGRVSEREITLVSSRTQDLNVNFSSPATVYGVVTDMAGDPLADVGVKIDGERVFTDELGEFVVRGVSSGAVLIVLQKEGYAHYREMVGIARGAVIPKDRMSFRMARGCTLEVRVDGAAGGPGAATVFLIPGGAERVNTEAGQRTFPWHLVSPVEVFPGSSARIEGLQEGRLNLMVFRPGAVAEQANVVAKLVSGRPNQASLRLKPARPLSGKVLRDGKPVRGARVVLEAPDRTRATIASLRRPPGMLNAMVLPHLPAALQEVETDARGLFRFTSYEGTERYYLTASQGEEWRASRTVGEDEQGIELELKRFEPQQAELLVELAGRFQGLPVEIRVDGNPRDPFVLAPAEDLTIDGLESGTWRVDVRWNGRVLVPAERIELGKEGRVEAELPEGAILGQSEEERRRAGL